MLINNQILHTVQQWSLDTLFPRYCVGCGAADQSLCETCHAQIVMLTQQHCIRCHKITEDGRTCSTCRRVVKLDRLLAAAHYADGPLKEALHHLKYHGRTDVVPALAALIANHPLIQKYLAQPDTVIVPVPLHRRKQWWRGFNQSVVLAKSATGLHVPLITTVLYRRTNTSTQTGLRRLGRTENVADAFQVRNATRLRGKTVILLDDVVTTGATIAACAAALHRTGVRHIMAVTIARAD